jgi:hypothetical protein
MMFGDLSNSVLIAEACKRAEIPFDTYAVGLASRGKDPSLAYLAELAVVADAVTEATLRNRPGYTEFVADELRGFGGGFGDNAEVGNWLADFRLSYWHSLGLPLDQLRPSVGDYAEYQQVVNQLGRYDGFWSAIKSVGRAIDITSKNSAIRKAGVAIDVTNKNSAVRAGLRAIDVSNPSSWISKEVIDKLPQPLKAIIQFVPQIIACSAKFTGASIGGLGGGIGKMAKKEAIALKDYAVCIFKVFMNLVKGVLSSETVQILLSIVTGNIVGAVVLGVKLIVEAIAAIVKGIAGLIIKLLVASYDLLQIILEKGYEAFRSEPTFQIIGGKILGGTGDAKIQRVGRALAHNAEIVVQIMTNGPSGAVTIIQKEYIEPAKAMLAVGIPAAQFAADAGQKGEEMEAIGEMMTGLGGLFTSFSNKVDGIPLIGDYIAKPFKSLGASLTSEGRQLTGVSGLVSASPKVAAAKPGAAQAQQTALALQQGQEKLKAAEAREAQTRAQLVACEAARKAAESRVAPARLPARSGLGMFSRGLVPAAVGAGVGLILGGKEHPLLGAGIGVVAGEGLYSLKGSRK